MAATDDYVIFVASGVPLSSGKFEALYSRFPSVVSKETIASASLLKLQQFQGDVLAAIDQQVLLSVDFFAGYFESTFSLEVAQQRMRLARKSSLHNAPWQNPIICAKHGIWASW